VPFRMFSSINLGCLGLSLDEYSICMLVGGLSEALGVLVWKMVPSCILWCLRREMNDRSFKDCERALEEIKSLFF
jgi:hypothetical protein